MSPLSIRRRLSRSRGRLAALLCVLALSTAVAAHHLEMPGMDHGGLGLHGAAAVMCLGILAVAAVAAARIPSPRRVGRWISAAALVHHDLWPTPVRAYPARAGPPLFLRLRVLRR